MSTENQRTREQLVPLATALQMAARFASDTDEYTERKGLNQVCIRSAQVEGTNGHMLMILQIDSRPELNGYQLIPAQRVLADAQDGDSLFTEYADSVNRAFPDTEKVLQKLMHDPVQASVYLDPQYLEHIGKAFRHLGVRKVKIVVRKSDGPVEFVGTQYYGHEPDKGRVLLMPME